MKVVTQHRGIGMAWQDWERRGKATAPPRYKIRESICTTNTIFSTQRQITSIFCVSPLLISNLDQQGQRESHEIVPVILNLLNMGECSK